MTLHNRILPSRSASGGRITPKDNLVRAVFALARAGENEDPASILRAFYPDDEVSPLVLRAATAPGSLTDPGWASALASTSVADFLSNLGPLSAASQLLRAVAPYSLANGVANLLVPAILPSAGTFVREGAPIPVVQFRFDGVTLSPRKVAAITVLTREMLEGSNAEIFVRQALSDSSALAFDAAFVSDALGDDIKPTGILNGVTAKTPKAGGGVDAIVADLSALGSAVAPVGGDAIAFLADPASALKIRLRSPEFAYPLFASGALPPGTVVAIALNALAIAASPVPRIETSTQAVLHYEDAAPAPISASGTVAAPVRSTFQTDTVAIRVIYTVTWGMRVPGAVAWTTGITW